MIPKQTIVEGDKKMHKVQTKKKRKRERWTLKFPTQERMTVWDRMQKGSKCVQQTHKPEWWQKQDEPQRK